MIGRRAFLAGAGAVLLAAPLAAEGQSSGKVYKIGYLHGGLSGTSLLRAFLHGLGDLGYVEGRCLAGRTT